ncbi:MAG: signal peptidase I [Verrucomicrobiales bacterium]
MFTPKWKKEAMLLVKGARKFVNYKRDLLKPERVAEIESRRDDLLAAIKSADRTKVDEASKQIRATCENSLRSEKAPGWFEENVEVMFVAIVIALGLRTYVLQPFRIPTGSMQPTLNGIIGREIAEKDWPALPLRLAEMVTRGRSYVKVINDKDRRMLLGRDSKGELGTDLRDIQYLHFFSRSELHFADGTTLRMPAPSSQIKELGIDKALEIAFKNGGVMPAGTVICEGTIDAGDLVLVDRMSYHFRRPTRGEVWVFDTRGIKTKKPVASEKREGMADQEEGTHYIKRLGAVPGDTLAIAPPNILINGKVATEPGFEKVYTLPVHDQPGKLGYAFANPRYASFPPFLARPEDSITLKTEAPPGMREYAALGDNSGNSLDSRYWGTVKEFNVVGPALFSLWPIKTGHWGFIR